MPALLLFPLGVSGEEAWHVLVFVTAIAPNKSGTVARRGGILHSACVG